MSEVMHMLIETHRVHTVHETLYIDILLVIYMDVKVAKNKLVIVVYEFVLNYIHELVSKNC